MITYPKIETLWNRDKSTFAVIEGDWRLPEFNLVKEDAWIYQEKIDGTNIRVGFDGEKVEINGRTDNAQIPGDLVAYLVKTFPIERLKEVFNDANPDHPVVLFGEGYGPGIQKGGGLYRKDKGFILFDVRVGEWWLEIPDVQDIGKTLAIPVVETYSAYLSQIVERLKADSLASICAAEARPCEGVIMRTNPTLRARSGERLIAKLKAVDFKHGKR